MLDCLVILQNSLHSLAELCFIWNSLKDVTSLSIIICYFIISNAGWSTFLHLILTSPVRQRSYLGRTSALRVSGFRGRTILSSIDCQCQELSVKKSHTNVLFLFVDSMYCISFCQHWRWIQWFKEWINLWFMRRISVSNRNKRVLYNLQYWFKYLKNWVFLVSTFLSWSFWVLWPHDRLWAGCLRWSSRPIWKEHAKKTVQQDNSTTR